MTPGCTKQACDFRDSLASLTAPVIGWWASRPTSPAKLAKFRERDAITFPLVSDPDKSVLQAYGAYGEKQLYGKTVTGVIRSTFVIDEKGAIEHAFYNVKATGHVAKLRRDLGLDDITSRADEIRTHTGADLNRVPLPLGYGPMS